MKPHGRLRESAKQAALAASDLEDRDDVPQHIIDDVDDLAGQADELKRRVEHLEDE